ncbi:MAG: DUF4936 family protein [Pseudomonadota bacterium]|nr:DUF4936 family protein [Pseudomonadota bacterium]
MANKEGIYHYFIYYSLGARDEDEVFNLTLSLMQNILHRTGVSGRLLKKNDLANTWLEIYEGISDPETFEIEMETVSKDWRNAYDTMGLERVTEKFTEFACLFSKN